MEAFEESLLLTLKRQYKERGRPLINSETWHHYIEKGYIDLIKFLIETGIDVNIKPSPLFHAITCNEIEILKLLLRGGANIHARNVFGETALHRAAVVANTDAIKVLIAEGSDLIAIDDREQTPLSTANKWAYICEDLPHQRDHIMCCKILIQHMVLLDYEESTLDVEHNVQDSQLTSFRHQCQMALQDMKREKIMDGVTLHDIVTSKSILGYIQNIKVRDILQEGIYQRKYSQTYGDILETKLKEGLKRLEALKVGEIVTSHIDGMIRDLGYHLTSYLNIEDIQNLRKAAIQTMDDAALEEFPPKKKKKWMMEK